MKKIPAAEFKARCLTLMDGVRRTREPVLITKHGKPIAKVVPADDTGGDFIGRLEGVVRIVGDIESPIKSPDARWEVYKNRRNWEKGRKRDRAVRDNCYLKQKL